MPFSPGVKAIGVAAPRGRQRSIGIHEKRNRNTAAAGRRRRRSFSFLRKVMEVVSAKGFAKVSIVDLTSAAGLGYANLRQAFGTGDEILRAAIRFCAETEACLAQEPLRVSPTGREAIVAMLEENERLRRHWPRHYGCLFTFNPFVVPPDEAEPQDFLAGTRRSLLRHIRARLARSVREGELPEGPIARHSQTSASRS